MSKKKQQIIEAAISLLRQTPLANMEEIASTAGVGRATLFRHFHNRQALIDDISLLCDQRFEDVFKPIEAMELPPLQKLHMMISASIPLGETFHFLSLEAFNLRNPKLQNAYQDDCEFWGRMLIPLQEQGVIDPDIPLIWLSETIENLVCQAWDLMNLQKYTHAQATRLVWKTLTGGLIKAE